MWRGQSPALRTRPRPAAAPPLRAQCRASTSANGNSAVPATRRRRETSRRMAIPQTQPATRAVPAVRGRASSTPRRRCPGERRRRLPGRCIAGVTTHGHPRCVPLVELAERARVTPGYLTQQLGIRASCGLRGLPHTHPVAGGGRNGALGAPSCSWAAAWSAMNGNGIFPRAVNVAGDLVARVERVCGRQPAGDDQVAGLDRAAVKGRLAPRARRPLRPGARSPTRRWRKRRPRRCGQGRPSIDGRSSSGTRGPTTTQAADDPSAVLSSNVNR